jgi:hypothetical protein
VSSLVQWVSGRWHLLIGLWACVQVGIAERVVSALGVALSPSDPAVLSRHTSGGALISLMRLFHYFPYTYAESVDAAHAQNTNERIGSSPHTYAAQRARPLHCTAWLCVQYIDGC